MNKIQVTGIGAITAAGIGFDRLVNALETDHSLATPYDDSSTEMCARVDLTESLLSQIPHEHRRRMGRLSRLATIAAMDLIRNEAQLRSDAGIVLGTGLGALQDTVDFLSQLDGLGVEHASPALFPRSVMNVASSHLSIVLGLHGFNSTVNHHEVSFELALSQACDALHLGHVTQIVCGGVDELGSAAFEAYRRFGALSTGMALGEGAILFLLERKDEALRRGISVIAEVCGIGITSSARHRIGWNAGVDGGIDVNEGIEQVAAAMHRALEQAHLDAAQIDLVIGSTCGIPVLDRIEASAIRDVFGKSSMTHVTTPHKVFGTWMSAGSLRFAAALGALARQRISPAMDANSQRPIRHVLCLAAATGGTNAAVVLSSPILR